MHAHSLELIEFPRVTRALAGRATSPRGARALAAAAPRPAGPVRELATARLAEAIRRQREPGAWAFACPSGLTDVFAGEAADPLDPEAFAVVAEWIGAGARTRAAWAEPALAGRFPRLAELVRSLPALDALGERIAATLDADGRVRDSASSALARARRGVQDGERALHRQLERWAAAHGAESYVTRFGDRFVALVPAAGGARKQGIVHDTSNTGQSLFVEPFEACEANNRLLELRAEAAAEERRLLLELAAAVRRAAPELESLEATLASLDALRASADWAVELGGEAIAPGAGRLRLVRARHPLLAMGERRSEVVPLDLELGPEARLLLVSGPNMGGKTVLLKTVGLAVALAHAALPVLAAEGSSVPEVRGILADLGDEQSVDRGLSTFAAHLLALKAMAESAGGDTLLLVDELGAGTDPEEGAALGRAFVEHLARRRAWAVVTSHLGSLKRVAGEIPGVANGSLEFDLATLTSRFRFQPGVPGASHALDVAGRLGFPEAILERARTLTPEEARALERLLAELGRTLAETAAERAALEAARNEAERAAAAHRETAEELKRALASLERRLTGESDALLARVRELWQTVQREARRRDRTRADTGALAGELGALEQGLDALRAAASPAALGLPEPPPEPAATALAPGTRVRVTDLGLEATVVAGPDAEGRVELRRGSMTIRSHASRLTAASAAAGRPERVAGPSARYEAADEAAPLEADLRGLDTGEALREVDQALDRAVLVGLHEVRLIHGVGTGALRNAVRAHLKTHPQVESQRQGEGHEGGRGVTVARLR